MASITYWSQLLPSPRAPSVAAGLQARVRDPAWLLARQWQLGEFAGADAGSPAFARVTSRTAKLAGAQLGASTTALGDAQLLEPLVEQEPFAADWATRVELGQSFEALLSQAGATPAVRDRFRAAYPIAPASAGADDATTRLLRVCAGRAVDGAALYAAIKAAPNGVPAAPALDATAQPAAAKACAAFVAWVESTWGAIGDGEPAAWNATRLEYDAAVTAGTGATAVTLAARADDEGDVDWYSFDATASTSPAAPVGGGAAVSASVLPGHVRFRGMPNARWWDFEGSKTDFGALVPDTRDLARLLFMDFLLLHGDDWLLAPLDVDAGSICFVDALVVTDVFGVATSVPRADGATTGARWTLFSTSDASTSGLAPFLVVPAAAWASLAAGAPIEEVHLLRDETADLAWAIEQLVEGAVGQPVSSSPPPPVAPPSAPAPLAYRLASPLPASWFPLLPRADANGTLTLVAGTVEGGPLAPSSRVVRRLSAPGFALADEEVPRAGVRVQRVACRARSSDGGQHLWLVRRVRLGAGAASSGLRYDVAQETT